MRSRDRILDSLHNAYRDAFEAARERDDRAEMARLDLDYQRDQLHFEVLLDLRGLLSATDEEKEKEPSLLEKAQSLRKITKLGRP